MILLQSLTRAYGCKTVVDGVTLGVRRGELMVLLGQSGSGKTTLLKMINRLVEPTSGEVRIDGTPVSETDPIALRRGIGYVFQDAALFPHLSVAENIALVPGLLGWTTEQRRLRVDELLALVGMEPSEFRERPPSKLSAGQRQRVALARALAAQPQVLLMDEPFAALDPVTRAQIQTEFKRLQKELSTTTLLVTHDVIEAFRLAARIAVMDRGRLVQVDVPEVVLKEPADEAVRQLLSTPMRQLQGLRPLWDLLSELPGPGRC